MPDSYLDSIPPRDLTLGRLLGRRAAEDPDGVFFSWAEATTTFRGFETDVDRMAARLVAEGIGAGTHVAVLMDSSPDYLTLWFALARVGAVEIPINTAYLGDVLSHQLTLSAATVCVADAAYAERIGQVASELPGLERLYVRGRAPAVAGPPCRDFADLLTGTADAAPTVEVGHDETAGIIFTSGTTGPSKGVLLSHHYLAAYGTMYADINGLRPDDVLLNFLPFFHVGAKFLTIATLVCGGRMRLLPRLSISTFLDEVSTHGVTNFVAVGGVCNMLLSKPPRADDARSSIRTIYAVPDPADIHEEMERRFGCRMTTVYGSTEVGLPIFRGIDDDYRPGSCGRQSPYYEVRIVDEQDNELPVGEPGELVIRPRRPFLVGSGYIGMPERTVEAWRNLWLHSGDRGRIDADGWFYFEDRATDSLRRRGENISSFEVETLVTGHPAVAEAIAVAAAADVGEDDVWVLVTLRDGMSVGPEELLRYCAEKMPYFMVPRYLDFVEDFPRTPTAKVEKYKLRAAGPGPTSWDRDAHGWRVTREGLVRTVGADLLGSR
ncbi:ATP-dependent acyl-CoA ligase [Pseudonocardia ailaonensis]|uniref:ATP-dependent acyl-CoA ligase n=1 Tax=Pseudonocardia ailaonensis TaxID=367279 RepID=A0ABN2N071_9PSEU